MLARVDRLQQRHAVLAFPVAVVRKYGDDEGARLAALLTYYSFLSVFPLLLLGVAVLSRALAGDPELRQRLVDAIVAPALRPTVEQALAQLPTSGLPLALGVLGLVSTGLGVVHAGTLTLNQVWGVPYRIRPGGVGRYLRALAMLAVAFLGAAIAGVLTVVATDALAFAGDPAATGLARFAAPLGTFVAVFLVLLSGPRILVKRPVPLGHLWVGAATGAAAATALLLVGAPLMARAISRAGPVYGSFATLAGAFSILYLLSQALVLAAEVPAVASWRLWPRGLRTEELTEADRRALTLLAHVHERVPTHEVRSTFDAAPDRPPWDPGPVDQP